MMGAGKSTVGRHLAKALNYKFFDTDQLIEKQENRTIEAIFKESGESYFRNIERDIINQFKIKNVFILPEVVFLFTIKTFIN